MVSQGIPPLEKNETTMTIIAIIGILVVVGLLLIVFITQNNGPRKNPLLQMENNKTKMPEKNITTNLTEICDDGCLYKNAIEKKEYSTCTRIQDQITKSRCFEELSALSLDACKLVENQSKREVCLTDFAKKMDNPEICSDILGVGRGRCERLTDTCFEAENKNLCKALKTNDTNKCFGESACLIGYSMAKNSTEACNLIKNNISNKACISAVTRARACHELQLESQRDLCYQLAGEHTKDPLVCIEISFESPYRMACYASIAGKLKDITVCDKSGLTLNDLWKCYANYSLSSGDIIGCKKIDLLATSNKFNCAFEFAKKFGDPSACEVIKDLGDRQTCYQGAMIYQPRNLNWINCANVTHPDWKNKCYIEAAKLTSNASLCDLIVENYSKQSCQDAYAYNKTRRN